MSSAAMLEFQKPNQADEDEHSKHGLLPYNENPKRSILLVITDTHAKLSNEFGEI